MKTQCGGRNVASAPSGRWTVWHGRLGRGDTGGTPVPHAFTLVELLVVIVIIAILIGLLVPAVAKVRRMGHETACQAVIGSIGTGLETYKASEKLGGTYPPSVSDYLAGSQPWNYWQVNSPYMTGTTYIPMTGAGLLVWALSGADLLGTPGFQAYGGAPSWGQSSGLNYVSANPATSDAYALDPGRQPVHTRYGPFVEQSKLKVTRNEATGGPPSFIVPAEREALGNSARQRAYPLYLDAFGYPVLYWRADPAGRQMADKARQDNGTQTGTRGIYHWEDNAALVDSQNNSPDVLTLNKSRELHVLQWYDYTAAPGGPSNDLTAPGFPTYIRDRAVKARYQPQRADSYLLVSPGYDGLYGTADDITNFQQNGQ